MPRRFRGALLFLGLLPLGVLVTALAYMAAMQGLEGESRDIWQSLAWAAETLTTTGYGHDNQWHHPAMILLVMLVQFLGLFLVLLGFPILLIPFFERRFEQPLPRDIPAKLSDFVLIYRYGPAVTSLIDDLALQHIQTVVLEEDVNETEARRLRDRGVTSVLTHIDNDDPFGSGLLRARALICNGNDPDNAVMVLNARQQGFGGPVYAFVENPLHRNPIVLAGADAVYSPKHALAAALAAKASDRISPRVAGLSLLGEDLDVAELRIRDDCPVAGLTLAEAHLGERTGATILGLWTGGEFNGEVTPMTVLQPRSILVAIGSVEAIEHLENLVTVLDRGGRYVVAGYGKVGQRVVQMLRDAGEEVFVIDRESIAGVDLAGDALDTAVLNRGRVADAKAMILALSGNGTNLFAATIVANLVPDLPIIARVNRASDIQRIHAAGADFALSIGQVASQLLGRRLLGEEFVALEASMRLTKSAADGFEGMSPVSSGVRERTGCSIVAIERRGEIFLNFERAFEIERGDLLYICGTGDNVERYF